MKRLTPAERRALEAIGQHGTLKAAAYALGRSPYTVDSQLRSARERLGVTTTVEAVWRVSRDFADINAGRD